MAEEQKQIVARKTENFESLYANNVGFEPSIWDLKMLFGQLDQTESKPGEIIVDRHSAITMSWPEVKIFAFYLMIQLTAYQADNAAIFLPQSVIPARPNSADPSIAGGIQQRKVVEYLGWIWDQFFGAAYLPSSVEHFEANFKEPEKQP